MTEHAWNFKDLTGEKINRWTVIKFTGKYKRRCPFWLCKCECGTIKEVSGNSLRNGSKSCGCAKIGRKWKNKIPLDISKIREIYARYRCEAKRRKLEFCIDKDFFLKLIEDKCFYCARYAVNKQKLADNTYLKYNGIDRVDNSKGYIIENCVTCCRDCNTHKKSITKEMIYKAYNFLYGNK